jgi:serine/threonine-protein kinase
MSPHLVRVTDLGRLASGEPFLVMDYLEGLDFEQIIEQAFEQKRMLSVAETVQWVLEASVGLAHLHAAGSVHRDVKPSNLFLAQDSSGRQLVKVLDFGLARAPMSEKGRLTTSSSSFGTPLYMAPEQFRSALHADARADQHALAHVLFELLTGEPAFWGDNPGAVSVAIATQPAALLRSKRPDAPEEVERAISKAMAKRPDDRFPSLGEFARALAKFGGVDSQRTAEEVHRLVGVVDRSSVVPAGSVLFELQAQPRTSRSEDETAVGPPELSSGSLSTTIPLARTRSRQRLIAGAAIVVGSVLGLSLAAGLSHWGNARHRDQRADATPQEPQSVQETEPAAPSSTPQKAEPASSVVAPAGAGPEAPTISLEAAPSSSAAAPSKAQTSAEAPSSSSAAPSSGAKAGKSAAPRNEPAPATTERTDSPAPKPVDPLSKYGGAD